MHFVFRLRQHAIMELYHESLFLCVFAARASFSRSAVASMASYLKTHNLPIKSRVGFMSYDLEGLVRRVFRREMKVKKRVY